MTTQSVQTPVLDLAYEAHGPADGDPVVLVHGFPDDARAWDGAATLLAAEGRRALAPHLRGFGPTRFLRDETPRSAQLAALTQDLLDFVDALGLERFTLVGADWGARAEDDGIDLLTPASTQGAERFPGGYRAQVVPGAGHFLHRERPDVIAEAVLGAVAIP